MAAGLGFKTFTTGEVLTAGDVNGYLMQGINVFASSAARAAAITSPQEGQYSYLKDTNALEYYDGAAWVGAPVGDITGVTAGVGITGGGTSGTVTVTNDMATTITAAGDIVVGTGSGTYDNLPIGTTAQVLTADTTVSPYKVKWATPAAPSFVGCSLTKVANQTTSAATYTVITFTSEEFDTNGFHDNSTNTSRITIPTGYAGKYLITGQISTTTGTETHTSAIKLNGSNFNTMTSVYSAQSGAGGSIQNVIMNLAVGDYVEFSQYSVSGVQVNGTAANNRPSSFACQYLGA
jgi:hypothetical protein